MKTFNPKNLVVVLISGSIFLSCKKDSSFISASGSTYTDDATAITEKVGIVTKLTIRPGLNDGQDTYVSKLVHYLPGDGNTNLDFAHELVMGKWYLSQYNDSARQRSYIRFDSLSKIPQTAIIVSAKLYLYGESSSLTYPFGNSYPFSSNPENSCIVKRVTGGTWQETTLTWNNKPTTTRNDSAIIPPSTSQFNYDAVADVTNMVAAIVSSGNNYGFSIELVNENIYRSMQFSTSEATNKALRPKLVIQYQEN